MSADRAPVRIALLGSFGEGNFGNEWTLDAFVELAGRVRPDLDLTIWSQNPAAALDARGAERDGFRALPLAAPDRPPRANPLLRLLGRAADVRWMWRVVGEVDVVLVPGTGIFERLYQRPGGYPATLALLVTICRLRRRPFALVGVGVEVPADRLSRRLVGYVLRGARLVTVRDDYSRASVAETTGGRVDPRVHADLVLAASDPDAGPPEPVDERVLALGVMDYRGGVHDDGDAVAAAYLRRTTDLARALAADGWTLRLVAGDEDDLAVADRVVAAVGGSAMVVPVGSLAEVAGVLARARVVVGTRFHTVVAAVGVGRPVVSLGYGPKNADLLTRVGLGELAHEVTTYDIGRVVAQVAEVDADHGQWSDLLAKGRSDLLGAGVPGLAELLQSRWSSPACASKPGSRPIAMGCVGLDAPSLVPRESGSTTGTVAGVELLGSPPVELVGAGAALVEPASAGAALVEPASASERCRDRHLCGCVGLDAPSLVPRESGSTTGGEPRWSSPACASKPVSRPTPMDCVGLDTPSLVPREAGSTSGGGGATDGVVTVVVATNRQSPHLDEALASVAAQSLTDWEGIVVDDGVPDPAWLDATVARHPGFRIVRADAGSVSRARNAGAAQAVGEYLAFLDDDDRWHPARLERSVAAMAAGAYVAACCPVDVIDERGTVTIPGRALERVDRRAVVRRDVWIACPNLLVRRDAFERAGGFDEALSRAEDLDLALRLAEHGEFVGVTETLVDYRAHGTNVTHDRFAMAVAIDRVVRSHRARAGREQRADHDASLRRNARYALFAARTRRVSPGRLIWLAATLLRTPWLSRR